MRFCGGTYFVLKRMQLLYILVVIVWCMAIVEEGHDLMGRKLGVTMTTPQFGALLSAMALEDLSGACPADMM